MTLEMISQVASRRSQIESKEGNTIIKIAKSEQQNANSETQIVESDWSSASYFYSLAAIGRETILLESFKENSLQGDKALVEIYERFFGVETIFSKNETIELKPIRNFNYPEKIELDMNDCPDIAQTLCVTASAMKIPFKITGLETLKVKETDRLVALQNELLKIGVKTKITENSIQSTEFLNQPNRFSLPLITTIEWR